jgi:nucleotide-binding universal stress UspA family protein
VNGISRQLVLVGVNGSTASAAALRWAADEAGRRNAWLRVVRSWDPGFDLLHAPYAGSGGWPNAAQRRAAAAESLAAQLRDAFGPVIGDDISAELAAGPAERVLVDRSAGADLLVVGAASAMASAGQAIGPVIRACLNRARCPVVVVRATPERATQEAVGRAHADGSGGQLSAGAVSS